MAAFGFPKGTDIFDSINRLYDEMMEDYTKKIEETLAVLLEENSIIVGDPAVLAKLRAAVPDKANDIVYSEYVSDNVILLVKKLNISSKKFCMDKIEDIPLAPIYGEWGDYKYWDCPTCKNRLKAISYDTITLGSIDNQCPYCNQKLINNASMVIKR